MSWDDFVKECQRLAEDVPNGRSLLEDSEHADLALPCFSLAKLEKKSPQEIARELEGKISKKKFNLVKKVVAQGPYLNFYINHAKFAPGVLAEVMKEKDDYGSASRRGKVVIEFPGPNTNKPLHLGHIRNMALGMALSNTLKFLGYDVKNVDIINDRGVHICKSMLAYKELGGGEPGKKSDHFVGDFYVLFAKQLEGKEGTEQRLRQMLLDWEKGDTATRALWKKMNGWALDGIRETYKRFGVRTDKAYYESEHYLDGKNVVAEGLKKNIFTKDEKGNIIIDLENLGKRVLLRADGTSLYITQDMVLAAKRYKDFHMDKMIYVVGEEQKDHFRALFKIFEILEYKFAPGCFHLSYGMVNLPEGKMKSREGTVVDADDLMDEMRKIAEEKLRERNVAEDEVRNRAEKIGLGAIKYFILKSDPARTMVYDPKASIDFEGDTGPYIQYTCARANSILRKSNREPSPLHFAEEKEFEIIKKVSQFPSIVEKTGGEYKPNILANYVFELATMFNEFYHSVRVLGEENEESRLAIVLCVRQVLENGLRLLGIEALNEM